MILLYFQQENSSGFPSKLVNQVNFLQQSADSSKSLENLKKSTEVIPDGIFFSKFKNSGNVNYRKKLLLSGCTTAAVAAVHTAQPMMGTVVISPYRLLY